MPLLCWCCCLCGVRAWCCLCLEFRAFCFGKIVVKLSLYSSENSNLSTPCYTYRASMQIVSNNAPTTTRRTTQIYAQHPTKRERHATQVCIFGQFGSAIARH